MSASDVENLLQSSLENAVAIFQGGVWNDDENATNAIPTPLFFTSDDGSFGFTDDFMIIFLLAEDYNGGFSWNHGRTCGVALSVEKRTAVFWAEDW